MKAKKKTIKLTLNYCETIFYWKTPTIDQVPRSSRRWQGRSGERGLIDKEGGVPAARVSERRRLFLRYDLFVYGESKTNAINGIGLCCNQVPEQNTRTKHVLGRNFIFAAQGQLV
jgi:hypothetical protein